MFYFSKSNHGWTLSKKRRRYVFLYVKFICFFLGLLFLMVLLIFTLRYFNGGLNFNSDVNFCTGMFSY